ncbi:hypothetical protein ACFV5N_11830 [Streptomyces sp. NPDC059853]|uniref:hypothetical protein n=1 Tax=Streptomyces sp. NPDC059853 TaxID=3346973 RepID=UPI00365D575E
MSTTNNRWTSEMLRTPEGRAIHLQQRRAQIQPVVDDLRRLARELQADLAEDGRLYGDLPLQDRLRAWHTAKPLFDAVDELEKALSMLVAGNKRYEKSYEKLPEKRAEKKAAKERAAEEKKRLKASAGQPPQIAAPAAGSASTSSASLADILGQRQKGA